MNSYIYEFKDLPSTDIPYNAETFNAMQNKLLDSVYPIGRGFIDFTDTDFSNYLGFTWERTLVGLTPVGLDASQTEFNTIGKTGGEKTHVLTINEMPRHSHAQYVTAKAAVTTGVRVDYNEDAPSGAYEQGINTGDTGNGQPHNNIQPTRIVMIWIRTA